MYVTLVVYKAFHINIYVLKTAAGQTLNTVMYKLDFTVQFPARKFIYNLSKSDYSVKKMDTLNEDLNFKV